MRTTFQAITDRFAGYQAEWLNVRRRLPALQRLARPIAVGAVRHPGLKIAEPRIMRLFEALLHGGPQVSASTVLSESDGSSLDQQRVSTIPPRCAYYDDDRV